MSEIKLPSGWVDTAFENVLDKIVGGGTPSKLNLSFFKGQIPFMTVKDMTTRFPTDTVDHISDEAVASSATTMVPKDSLIVATRMSLGKIVRPKFDTAINQDLKALFLTDGMHKTYIEYFWRSKANHIQDLGTGTTVKGIRLEDIRSLTIPLAPVPEQKRIADKLDTVLARVDACRERLNRVPLILKRFKQSVLAAATSGKLTEDWRNSENFKSSHLVRRESSKVLLAEIEECQNAAKIKIRGGAITPVLSDLPDDFVIPDSWVVTGFDSLAAAEKNALKAGPFGSALKKSMYVAEGYKIYGQEQVIAGDEAIGDYFISQEKFDLLSSCAVKSGDILVSLVGTIGKVLILSDKCQKGIINPRLVKFSLHEKISRKYIAYYLNSPTTQRFFASQSHGGTMDVLNLGILRELPILLPPETEQLEIVRRVETLFAFADRLEARLTTARNATDRLTPALLAKAFRGELVPQDPDDEPASELLVRISAMSAEKIKKPKVNANKQSPKNRVIREKKNMAKSRQDVEVKHQPYLAEQLRQMGGAANVEALFKTADLPVIDFYKQLAWEVENGHIRDANPLLEAA